MDTGESSSSLWKADAMPARGPLENDGACDVCVVGGGFAGLSAAYELSREGRRVIVLDARDIAGGETAQTTAHLASELDDRFSHLERIHGESGARIAYESHAQAIDRIETIAEEEGIRCDFRRLNGYLFLGPQQSPHLLENELAAARRAGLVGAERLARVPTMALDTGPCLSFPNQATFHPLRYLAGLASAIERNGGTIYARTPVVDVSGGNNARVRTAGGRDIRAGAIIVATNSPIHSLIAIHSKQAPYRTYAIALRMPAGTIEDALYWDTSDPYHYVRLDSPATAESQLIVGGEDHRTGTADDAKERYLRLEGWARRHFPGAGEITFRWSGQVLEPFDGLAFIGKDPGRENNVYLATGDSGHGITHGMIAGILLTALIAGRDHPWAKLYDPSRKSPRAVGEYAHDNVEVALEYSRWLKPERRVSVASLAPGEGTVIQRGVRKVAVYRDVGGGIHERSAVCTHLGCIVRWNSDSTSWDCACHGSRFAPSGEVLNGPATRALSAVEAEHETRPTGIGRSIAVGVVGGALAALAVSAWRTAPPRRMAARRTLPAWLLPALTGAIVSLVHRWRTH
jgi:glycine/D-amino acid oxidase-like deaminating enzyme/nitrite reductase/ring-hydroxylating ferredoxin subunit